MGNGSLSLDDELDAIVRTLGCYIEKAGVVWLFKFLGEDEASHSKVRCHCLTACGIIARKSAVLYFLRLPRMR